MHQPNETALEDEIPPDPTLSETRTMKTTCSLSACNSEPSPEQTKRGVLCSSCGDTTSVSSGSAKLSDKKDIKSFTTQNQRDLDFNCCSDDAEKLLLPQYGPVSDNDKSSPPPARRLPNLPWSMLRLVNVEMQDGNWAAGRSENGKRFFLSRDKKKTTWLPPLRFGEVANDITPGPDYEDNKHRQSFASDTTRILLRLYAISASKECNVNVCANDDCDTSAIVRCLLNGAAIVTKSFKLKMAIHIMRDDKENTFMWIRKIDHGEWNKTDDRLFAHRIPFAAGPHDAPFTVCIEELRHALVRFKKMQDEELKALPSATIHQSDLRATQQQLDEALREHDDRCPERAYSIELPSWEAIDELQPEIFAELD